MINLQNNTYQYSILSPKNLEEQVSKHQIFKSLQGKNQRKFLDRCKIIEDITVGYNFRYGRNLDANVDLSSKSIQKFIGSNYSGRVLTVLQDIDFLEVNNSYSNDEYHGYSKSYSPNKNYIPYLTAFHTKQIEDKYNSYWKNIAHTSIKSSVGSQVVKNFLELDFNGYLPEVKDKDYKDIELAEARMKYNYDHLAILTKCTSSTELIKNGFRLSFSQYGRLYYTLTNIQRALRHQLTHNSGLPMYEHDMNSSHLTLQALSFSMNFISYYNSNLINSEMVFMDFYDGLLDGLYEKVYMLLRNVLQASVYVSISNHSKDIEPKIHNLYLKDYDSFKGLVMSWLYGKNIPSPMQKVMKSLYPEFTKWINDFKRHDHKRMTRDCLKHESEVFIKPTEGFWLPVHDSILTIDESSREVIIQRIANKFNIPPDYLVNTIKTKMTSQFQ